jgi:hypothetical protein
MLNSQESKIKMNNITDRLKKFFQEKSSKLSSETLGWLAILFIHGATLPGLLAMMTGLTDNPPPVDVIIMVWSGLLLFFMKAAIQRDLLNLITIGLGFMVQALFMILIFFK